MDCQVVVFVLVLGLALAVPYKGHKYLLTRQNRGKNGGLGIYDGKITTIAKHPYIVGLVVDDELKCAGVIVGSSYALTTGDCVYGVEASEITVYSGSSDGTSGTSDNVKTIITHPDFDYDTMDYDFALLKISGTFTWGSTVANVSLPTAAPATGTPLVVSGWGDTSDVESDNALLQGKMYAISQKVCKSDYSDYSITFTDRLGCAYNKGRTTCCEGDFGDPFVRGDVLHGLFLSSATEGFCSSSALPVIYAEVASVASWIQNYV